MQRYAREYAPSAESLIPPGLSYNISLSHTRARAHAHAMRADKATTDAKDTTVFFAPYYFNHVMAAQMTGGAAAVEIGPCNEDTLLPDLDWLEDLFTKREKESESDGKAAEKEDKDKGNDKKEEDEGGGGMAGSSSSSSRIRTVTLVNPGNPTGVTLPESLLRRASALCKEYGAWLILDNTYESFTGAPHYALAVSGSSTTHTMSTHKSVAEAGGDGNDGSDGPPKHVCFEDDHIVNIFSFSKAFGMMGWRLGYIAAPAPLQLAMRKVHDTIAICASAAAQRVGLAALQVNDNADAHHVTVKGSAGGGNNVAVAANTLTWVEEKVASLAGAHNLIRSVLTSTLGGDAVRGGSGAIYFLARLPSHVAGQPADDEAAAVYLARRHGVVVIPASSCGYVVHPISVLELTKNEVDASSMSRTGQVSTGYCIASHRDIWRWWHTHAHAHHTHTHTHTCMQTGTGMLTLCRRSCKCLLDSAAVSRGARTRCF